MGILAGRTVSLEICIKHNDRIEGLTIGVN